MSPSILLPLSNQTGIYSSYDDYWRLHVAVTSCRHSNKQKSTEIIHHRNCQFMIYSSYELEASNRMKFDQSDFKEDVRQQLIHTDRILQSKQLINIMKFTANNKWMFKSDTF